MSTPIEFLQVIQNTATPQFKYFESIGSTNQIALEWMESGAPDLAIVFSDHQSAGRGRLNRSWVTEPGSAIALSIIIKPTANELQNLALFSPLAGIALVDCLKKNFSINAQIKWPNDVLIDRQKTCGILTESVWRGNKLLGLVVGIGINVTPASVPPREEVFFPATCLQNHCIEKIDRYDLLEKFIQSFKFWRDQLPLPAFMDYWQESLAFLGETVYINQNDESGQINGVLTGITSSGDLQLRTENNQLKSIFVGDVHLRPAEDKR